MTWEESKFLTSQANVVPKPSGLNRVMGPAPLMPEQSASQNAGTPMPTGETTPIPVTTTRRFIRSESLYFSSSFFFR